MLILTIRTDNPKAEIGLFDDAVKLGYKRWPAHRILAETLYERITELLTSHSKALDDVKGIVAFQGPGSFTGLRIGLSVANALAYGLEIPIVAASGDEWIASGITRLLKGGSDPVALPEYGAPVHITTPKR